MHPNRLDALTRRLGDATSRRSLLGLLGGGVVGTAVAAVGITESQAKSKRKRRKRDKGNNGKGHNGNNGNNNQNASFERFTGLPVSAHDNKGHNFKGTLDITSFAVNETGDAIIALGTVSGKVTGKGVGNKSVTNEPVTVPVSFPTSSAGVRAQATCNILDLTLGPIHLDLLGLVLDTNQIHIQLTANTAGGLLGQLLCSIAGLLDGGLLQNIAAIVAALNNILTILQQL